MKKNRIIFVINNYGFYETHRKDLLSYLSTDNEVHLITNLEGVTSRPKNTHHLDIGRRSLNIFFDLIKSFKLGCLVKKINPTHIFFVSFKPMALGIFSAIFLTRVKKYLIFSGLGYSFINKSFKAFIAKSAIKIFLSIYALVGTKFIFQNSDDLDEIKRITSIKKKNIHIISGNGINQKQFKPKKNSLEKRKLNFLFVGRLLVDKGIKELLNAIKLIKDEANFVIVAPEDKENRASVDSKIMKPLWGKKHIQIFDKVDHKNLKKLYMDADVFILPSYREGLPRAALEAMCSKLPLILTNVPGCRECIINNENGFLVEPKSTTSLVDAICKFIENPEIIERMGKKSYEIVKERFSNDIIFKKYAELL